jgi:hypothetical protein
MPGEVIGSDTAGSIMKPRVALMDSSSGYQFPTMICTTCVFTLHGPQLLHGQTLALHGRVSAPRLANRHKLLNRTGVPCKVVHNFNHGYQHQNHRQL